MSDISIHELEARHRLEEIFEPYGLYPCFDVEQQVYLGVEQFGPATGSGLCLAEAFVMELTQRGVEASIEGPSLILKNLGYPSQQTGHQDGAEIDEALYAIRRHHPARFLGRMSQGTHVPHDGNGEALYLPRSDAFRGRLVAGDFMPDDKKPPVLDLHRGNGPYLASIDDEPLVIQDVASQIATHAGGVNPPEVLESLFTGDFGRLPVANPDTRNQPGPVLASFASLLRERTCNTLPYIAFCGSGAEANEMALRIASRLRPGKRKIVAFEGSFHGRTMAVLHATWNPAKRERFELSGFEASWCPWPTSNGHDTPQGPLSLAGWDEKSGSESRALPDGADPLEASEWASLVAVERAFETDEAVAIIAEPMQAEGGERHVSDRFFMRLRALASAYSVPFIVDEVQCGFGLGGPFFWHYRFPLTEAPDVVTIAKKAMVGGILSRHPIEGIQEVHVASAVRGLCQAAIIDHADIEPMEAEVKRRLDALHRAHPDTVLAPRCEGYSFGFDLPDKESVGHLISQRLWRGWMLYGAGSTAVRFRLHPHVSERAINAMFQRLDDSLTQLEAGDPATWRQVEMPDPMDARPEIASLPEGITLERLDAKGWARIKPAVTALQAEVYEPARRDNLEVFEAWMADADSIAIAAWADDELAGLALAFPLEHVGDLDGPAQDPTLGWGRTLYSAEVVVASGHRGKGLGLALKDAQVKAAMTATGGDGKPRFDYMTGRNRVGETEAMQSINARYGAWESARFGGQYGEEGGVASYYRICLTTPRLPEITLDASQQMRGGLELDHPLETRLGGAFTEPLDTDAPARELLRPLRRGVLNGAIANKMSLCNFVTPGIVRSVEMLREMAPRGMAHLVTASSRSETCDKGLRAIKYHRGQGRIVVSIGPVHGGQNTSAARTLGTKVTDHDNWFGWPTTADPTLDAETALSDLKAAIEEHGAEQILALVIEPVYQRTGRAVPTSFWAPLRELADAHGLPIVAIESATAAWRAGKGLWRSDSLPVNVDSVWWYVGGQLGLVFLSDALYVPAKLTLISTWDGDGVGFHKLLWELRALRQMPLASRGRRLGQILEQLGEVEGEGLYRTVHADDPDGLIEALRRRGVRVGQTDEGALRFCPSLDITDLELDRLEAAITEVA